MRKLVLILLTGWAVALVANVQAHAVNAPVERHAPIKVVYHLDADSKGTTTALHQAKNELAADPTTKIVIVAIGKSVPFMLRGSKTEGGYPYALMIEDLQQMGVRIEACDNTMKTMKIDPKRLDDGIVVVPSGMDELARLQALEHYVYIKP